MKIILSLLLLCAGTFTFAQSADTLSINLESISYGYPVKYLNVKAEKQDLKMAYLDVKPPAKANGKTIMLFHGKTLGVITGKK